MIFRQLTHDDLGCASSLIGDENAGAWLSDRIPQRALGRGFAVLVVAVAGYLLVSVAFLGAPPGSS